MSILIPGQELSSPSSFPLHARSGWQIPTSHVNLEPPAVMRIRNRELISWRRGLTVRSDSLYPYNCVGMIFASRRAWIEIDHIYGILREDGYRQISLNQAVEGDVVLYQDREGTPTHVALIITIDRSLGVPNIKVLSKWGVHPEFIHFIDNVTEMMGEPAQYYTERASYDSN